MNQWLKNKFLLPLIGGLILAICVDVMFEVRIASFLSIILFSIVWGIMWEQIEKDTAGKRGLKFVGSLLSAMFIFVAFRIVVGYFTIDMGQTYGRWFNFPESWDVFKKAEGDPKNWVLELLFLIVGLKLAKEAVFHNRKKFLNFLTIASLGIIIWQTGQKKNAESLGELAQAGIDHGSVNNLDTASKLRQEDDNRWAIVLSEVSEWGIALGPKGKMRMENIALDDPLPQGTVLKLGAKANQNDVTGKLFTCVKRDGLDTSVVTTKVNGRLTTKTLPLFGSDERWIESRLVKRLNNVQYVPGQYLLAREGKVLYITVYTDQEVSIDPGFSPSQQIIITGIPAKELELPDTVEPEKYWPAHIGQKVTLSSGLVFKANQVPATFCVHLM